MNKDELVKQAKQFLENEAKGASSGNKETGLDSTPNVLGMAPDEFEFSVGRLDMLVAAMWMLMKEKGFTDEELMDKVVSIIDEQKGIVYPRNPIKCSKCGNNIQEVKKTPLTGRCFYCGTTYILYPYGDNVEVLDDKTSSEPEKPAAEPAEEIRDELPETFEPYDVSKDLRFDEEE